MHGIGRKMFVDLRDIDKSYIIEGEFNQGELDGTFGRKSFIGLYHEIGWFTKGRLHGYGSKQ